jgi:hypothetical protein
MVGRQSWLSGVLVREDTRNRACGQIQPERRAKIIRRIFRRNRARSAELGEHEIEKHQHFMPPKRIWLSFIVFSIVSEDFLQVRVPFSVVFLNANLEK